MYEVGPKGFRFLGMDFHLRMPRVVLQNEIEIKAASDAFVKLRDEQRNTRTLPTEEFSQLFYLSDLCEEWQGQSAQLKIKGERDIGLLKLAAGNLLTAELDGIEYMNENGFAASEEFHLEGPDYIPTLRQMAGIAVPTAELQLAA